MGPSVLHSTLDVGHKSRQDGRDSPEGGARTLVSSSGSSCHNVSWPPMREHISVTGLILHFTALLTLSVVAITLGARPSQVPGSVRRAFSVFYAVPSSVLSPASCVSVFPSSQLTPHQIMPYNWHQISSYQPHRIRAPILWTTTSGMVRFMTTSGPGK